MGNLQLRLHRQMTIPTSINLLPSLLSTRLNCSPYIMNDIELKEEITNVSMLARAEGMMQAIEKVLVEHGHASDTCAAKIAEILGVSEKLPDVEEVSLPLRSEVDK